MPATKNAPLPASRTRRSSRRKWKLPCKMINIIARSTAGRDAMLQTTKTLGTSKPQPYWLFDPRDGRDMASLYADGVQPQRWSKEQQRGDEQRRVERRRYDCIVKRLTDICVEFLKEGQ